MVVVPDYSYLRYGGSRLRALGFSGVARYAGVGRNSLNITKGESDELKANDLGIAIITEHEPDWLTYSPSQVKDRVAGAVQITQPPGHGPSKVTSDTPQFASARTATPVRTPR